MYKNCKYNHQQYKYKKCSSIGFKENDCSCNIIMGSCNPLNSNFAHKFDLCLKYKVKRLSNSVELISDNN